MCYIVYCNKSHDVWARDAYEWAKSRDWEEGKDYKEILSQMAFNVYLDKGLLDGVPIYFVKDILTNH